MKHLFSFLLFSISSPFLFSQNQFEIVGNSFGVPDVNSAACSQVDTCFTLTPDANNQAGAVWDLNPIDLSKKFDALFCLTLGVNDGNGADGFAFVLRGVGSATIGQVGGGLGYVGITPSLAIEFDTWDNGAVQNDLATDHTGMYANSDFVTPLVSSVPLEPAGANVEDGNYHTTRIVWDPEEDSLKMYFDGNLRLAYEGDILNDIFGGQTDVLWGFTASTGGSTNLQQICFPYRSIHLQDTMICEGDSVAVSYYTDNITSYKWTDIAGNVIVDWDAASGDPFDLNDTLFYAYETNQYILNIEFNNNVYTDTADVVVIPLPQQPFTATAIEFCPATEDLLLDAQNPGSSYVWSPTGATTQTIMVGESLGDQGYYHVTITEPVNNCQNEDSILIAMYCLPILDIPNVITPNGDGVNDVFELILSVDPMWVDNLEFRVVNRWGNSVYESNQLPSWNGKSGSGDVPEGVYFYTLKYTDTRNEQVYENQGFVTVVR